MYTPSTQESVSVITSSKYFRLVSILRSKSNLEDISDNLSDNFFLYKFTVVLKEEGVGDFVDGDALSVCRVEDMDGYVCYLVRESSAEWLVRAGVFGVGDIVYVNGERLVRVREGEGGLSAYFNYGEKLYFPFLCDTLEYGGVGEGQGNVVIDGMVQRKSKILCFNSNYRSTLVLVLIVGGKVVFLWNKACLAYSGVRVGEFVQVFKCRRRDAYVHKGNVYSKFSDIDYYETEKMQYHVNSPTGMKVVGRSGDLEKYKGLQEHREDDIDRIENENIMHDDLRIKEQGSSILEKSIKGRITYISPIFRTRNSRSPYLTHYSKIEEFLLLRINERPLRIFSTSGKEFQKLAINNEVLITDLINTQGYLSSTIFTQIKIQNTKYQGTDPGIEGAIGFFPHTQNTQPNLNISMDINTIDTLNTLNDNLIINEVKRSIVIGSLIPPLENKNKIEILYYKEKEHKQQGTTLILDDTRHQLPVYVFNNFLNKKQTPIILNTKCKIILDSFRVSGDTVITWLVECIAE